MRIEVKPELRTNPVPDPETESKPDFDRSDEELQTPDSSECGSDRTW